MKNALKIAIIGVLAAVMAGCEKNSIELGRDVQREMQKQLVSCPGMRNLIVESVCLVKTGEVTYHGVGVGRINGKEIRFDVNCEHDGHSTLWDARLAGLSDRLVVAEARAREAGQDLCVTVEAKVKEVGAGAKRTGKELRKRANALCQESMTWGKTCCEKAKGRTACIAERVHDSAKRVSMKVWSWCKVLDRQGKTLDQSSNQSDGKKQS